MKNCRHRGNESGAFCQCKNTSQLLHNGWVLIADCNTCPYHKEADYFSANSTLWQSKQTAGEYTPQPRACGGCGTFKERSEAVQFCWPYWHGGACGDELRFSIRSVEANYRGQSKITIVGDRPEWFRGHVINCPRISADNANRPYRDMLNKMWVMATHGEIDTDFVWIMDDVYLLKPVTWDDLDTPRAWRWWPSKGNSWQRRKTNTMAALAARGKSQHDYATHLPHTVERAKLRELFDTYKLRENTMLWEVLYGNEYRGRPWGTRPFFARLTSARSPQEIARAAAGASIVNHYADCWNKHMRQWLVDQLPTPAIGEIANSGWQPQFRKKTRATPKPVKRRAPVPFNQYMAARAKAGK